MFPCWDEPAFRATFQLTATVPAAWTSVSNMPIESRIVHGAWDHDVPALAEDAVVSGRVLGR